MTRTFSVNVDAEHGGRWTSLTDPAGVQWLWTRQAPGRDRPGTEFVDVGGLEECFPTVGGSPDHGQLWRVPWHRSGDIVDSGVAEGVPAAHHLSVTQEDVTLSRVITCTADAVTVNYHLTATPGRRFVWAAHTSIEPTAGTQIHAPEGHRVRAWPGHVRAVETTWPAVLGIEGFDTLPDNDGSAMFCLLPDLARLSVVSPRGALRFRLSCSGQPIGFGLWRNLSGYPWNGVPYRNFVVEPMLGHDLCLAQAGPGDAATVPKSGIVEWQLEIS